MSEANERQVAGNHYSSAYQHWDMALDLALPYLPAQVTKYLTRWKKKNGVQDVEKSAHFLDKFIESEEEDLARHLTALQVFYDSNAVGSYEQRIMNYIVTYRFAGLANLKSAAQGLQELLATAKGVEPITAAEWDALASK